MRRVKIHTFGCQMNVYDSDRMAEDLAALGYLRTEADEDADLIILNTCSVREKPEQKVLSLLGRLKPLKDVKPDLLLAVGGCVGEQHGQALVQAAPYVDLVFGPDRVGAIGELVATVLNRGGPLVATGAEDERGRLFRRAGADEAAPPSAFVLVMKGCDQYCSYCIVPHVRGREVSRAPETILEEARDLLDRGARELTLLGQNVNRYGMDREGLPGFAGLLKMIHELPGLERLGFTTSNPGDCPRTLIDCFAELPRLNPYFHLPMQSGSDAVLARMNRRYDRARYFELVRQLREARPGLHLSTDLIVGFPGETREDYELTLEAAQRVRWGSSFSFMYSPRPGTAAAALEDDVPRGEKLARLSRLQALLGETMMEGLSAHVGRTERVLVEGPSRRGGDQVTGRTDTGYVVNFTSDGALKRGDLVSVRIEEAWRHCLHGVLTDGGSCLIG